MIAVRLEGRLGNQLFQYAFAYAAAEKLDTHFYLDKSVDRFLLPEYFNVRKDCYWLLDQYLFSISGFKNLFSYHARIKFYQTAKNLLRLKTVTFNNENRPAIELEKLENQVLYNGFFQSEEYFINIKNEILDLFEIKEKYKNEFNIIKSSLNIPDRYIVIHIRRGDYVGHGYALYYKYFHDAIRLIHSENNFYVFVSDEPGKVFDEFKYINAKYISDNKEIIDFQFLTNAVSCILSNSTFSWWGAYLNRNNPIIICPQYFLGWKTKVEVPYNIYPINWIQLECKK